MPETLVPERDRQEFVDAMAGYLATGDRSGFSRRVRLRALRADGTERAVELTPMPVTVGGHTYFFGFLRDASELEERHQGAWPRARPGSGCCRRSLRSASCRATPRGS